MLALRVVAIRGKGHDDAGSDPEGQYICYYDPEAFAGKGEVGGTTDPAKALKFATLDEAIAFYRQVSKSHPVRPDGMPNRPLTAFTVELIEV